MDCRKYSRLVLISLSFLWLVVAAGSCIMEDFEDECGAGDYSAITVKVKLPDQTTKSPFTKATGLDYDKVADMNIMISDGTTIKKRLYLDFAGMKWEDGTLIANGSTNTEGVTISYADTDGFRLFTLDFEQSYWAGSGLSLKDCEFHSVANWEGKITDADDNNLVANLRRLKASAVITENNNQEHAIVKTPNVMYGEIIADDEPRPLDPAKPYEKTRVVTIGLKRTAAMITLEMNGELLDKGVVIELATVALHNVPITCTLGADNAATTENIGKYGDLVGGPILARGTLIGNATRSMTGFGDTNRYLTTIGGHYEYEDGESHTVKVDYNKPVMPLFLYENKQPTGTQVSHQSMKRPLGVASGNTGATDAEKRQIMNAIASYNENGVCSYIEITGTYTKYADDMSIAARGPVVWRFFLGGNETDDFNVERNKNYRLTLTLTGSGIGEANTSWRVDDNTEKPTIVGETEMVVGGGGEMFCVQPNSDLASAYPHGVKLKSVDGTFVYAYTRANSTEEWVQTTGFKGNTNILESSLDGKQIWFYVKPLLPDDPYNGYENGIGDGDPNQRSCTIEFVTNNGSSLSPPLKVSFTQYRPVTFSITEADLANSAYTSDPDFLEAKRLIETYYKHDFETGGEFKFYADRIDRAPLQWGFSGVQLDKNQNTGFENVYHLIDPLPVNTLPTCQAHIEYAKNYLPTGRGWKEADGHIDYNNGSCMMHAAMENYFQQYYPYPGGSYNGVTSGMVTPQQLYNMGLPPRPGSAGDNTTETSGRRYSWCVPSIVGWKLVEILDRFYKNHGITDRGFDPKYPVTKWVSYWTSNAATADLKEVYPDIIPEIDGKNRSFVYQFGMGLDKIGTRDEYPGYLLMDRTSKVKYRLLNIKPDSVK